MQTPVRARRSRAPGVRRAIGVALALVGWAGVVWSLVGSGGVPAPASWVVGAALGVIGLAVAIGRRVPRDGDSSARPPVLDEGPISETDLRSRIAVLADVARAEGTDLALVLVGPASPRDVSHGPGLGQLLEMLTAQSRGDDLRAELGDAAGVLLPSVTLDEACGYAVRITSASARAAGGLPELCAGVALTGSDQYPAAALLRRARRALAAARVAGPGAVTVAEPGGAREVDRRSIAARPSVGRRARR